MGGSWVIQPDVDRVPVGPNGDWLELKRELTYGDRRTIRQATYRGVTAPDASGPDGKAATTYQVDPSGFELATVEAYLVAWSLKGPDDKPLDIGTPQKKRDMLTNTLHEAAFAAVLAAVQQHIGAVEKKNVHDAAAADAERRAECRLMYVMHWTYAELLQLPASVYDAAVAFVNAEVYPSKAARSPDDVTPPTD